MRLGAAFWIQRTTWPELRDAVVRAEAAGFDDVYVDDHLLCDEGDWTDPKLEGWATLAALAAVTRRVRLGLLVAANTFRAPALTAKLATTLDHVSDGRAILGIGAGWYEREHEAFGIDFGSGFGERLDRLAESLAILRRLLDGERFDHEGTVYRLQDALALPGPVQPHLPILIGGSGPLKTLPLVARYADIWNIRGTPEQLARHDDRLRERFAEIGRDPGSLDRTVYLNVVIRRDRREAIGVWDGYRERHHPPEGEDRPEVVGSVEDVAGSLRAYRAVGFSPIWVFRSPFDTATVDALPAVRDALGDPAVPWAHG
jgi:F420-dependent oxidoreductase-like protein